METGSNPRVCALRTPNIVTTTSHEVHPLTNEDIKRWAKFAENIRPLNGAYVANSRTIDIIQRAINTKDALERPPYSLATWSIPILKCDWVADNQLLPFSSKVAAQEWIDKQKTPYKFTNKE